MKRITLCADDFGIHPSVSEAIITLAQQQRIQASSALVTSKYCQQDAKDITRLNNAIDIGLHLNFTEGSGLSPAFKNSLPGLASMLVRSHCRWLSHSLLMVEIRAQLDRFEDLFGMTPDFIDGHQHVHHLPIVRDALIAVLAERHYEKLWIRSVTPMFSYSTTVKSKMIEWSGAAALKRLIEMAGFETNHGFAGVYSLSKQAYFEKLMSAWLSAIPDRGLIMCHPALATNSDAAIDHKEARHQEYLYLTSNQFLSALQSTGATLTKYSQFQRVK